MRRTLLAFMASAMFTGTGWAQDAQGLWVQIEALPTLSEAQNRASAYAAFLPDVTGWTLGSGWYAIALGPYAAEGAREYAAGLRASRSVPQDAYVTDGASYRTQFWPVGIGADTSALPLPQNAQILPPQDEPAIEAAPLQAAPPPEETPREAERSEAALSRAQKEELQRALHWAGVYEGKIDGAYGRGTRASMAAWQEREGLEATGILTTRQREALLASFNAPLESLGLERLRDERAGIEVEMPLGLVAFKSYEPPFVRFASQDGALEVLLLSQSGDAARMSGVYEILQARANIPESGKRELTAKGFTLGGSDATHEAYAEAHLINGQIKGFVILSNAGDSDRIARLKGRMSESFSVIDGVLPEALSASDASTPLTLRLPPPHRLQATEVQSGFFVSAQGHVLTAAEPLAGCSDILIENEYPAQVVGESAGALLLAPKAQVTPRALAPLAQIAPQSVKVAVAGYPFAAQLSSPALTFGESSTAAPFSGRPERIMLTLAASKGDIGGPVLAENGAVVGLLLPQDSGGKVLPAEAQEALGAPALAELLRAANITPAQSTGEALSTARLVRAASSFTAQITCR